MAYQITSTDKTLDRMRSNPNPTLGERASASERAMSPEVHGLLNALVGLPGLRLRKLSDIPDVIDPKTGQTVKPGQPGGLTFDFYTPFSGEARPDEYSSFEEQLAYNGGEGRGDLLNAATLIPSLARRAGRLAGEGIGKFKLGQANKQAGQAAEMAGQAADWMSPTVKPTAGPALLGDEAARLANEAGERMGAAQGAQSAAEQYIQNARNWGSSGDNVINTLEDFTLAGRPLVSGAAALMNNAASSVERGMRPPQEGIRQPQMSDFQQPQQSVQEPVQQVPAQVVRPINAETLQSAMAGRKQPTAWERPERNFITRAADFLNQRQSWERDQGMASRHVDNQLKQLGFVDPETEYRMQQAGADAALGRAKDLSRDNAQVTGNTPGQQFAGRYAPAMDVQQLEEMYGLPPGSVNPELLRRMGAEKEISPMDLMMMQMLQNMNFGPGPQGKFNNAPKLNVPPAR